MDPCFQENSLRILPLVFQYEDIYRCNLLPINPYDYFPNTLQALREPLSSPLVSEKHMIYCAKEIERLYPNLKPAAKIEFQTLNNRIQVWKKTRSNPAERFAALESLPAYVNNKFKLIEDLLLLLSFEATLCTKFQENKTTLCASNGKDTAAPLRCFKEITTLPLPILTALENLIEAFPYLEFILSKQYPNQKAREFMPPITKIHAQVMLFSESYQEIQEDQAKFNTYLMNLHLARFGTFGNLVKTLKDNNQETLKKIFFHDSFEELIYQLTRVIPLYPISDDEWTVFTARLGEIYPEKILTMHQKGVFSAFNNTLNPKVLALDTISYSCCTKEPSQRIAHLTTLNELNQLVSYLQQEVSMMSHIEHHFSTSKAILKLFASKQKNSFEHIDNFRYTGYRIAIEDFKALAKPPYVMLGNTFGHPFLYLKKIEKKYFNPKTLSKDLDSLIKKSSSSTLKDIFQSMKDHVELIRLVKTNCLEPDQSYLQSLKKSTTDRSLTPFLNDMGRLIQFFDPQTVTPEYFNNPTPPKFFEANQSLFEKIQDGWKQNKHHQKLLLDYAQKQIASIKKANQTSKVQKIKPMPVAAPTPVKKDKKVIQIKTPKILEAPIAIAKALIQDPPALPPFPISSSTLPQVNVGPIARGMRSLTQPPPGNPFRYSKTQRVLDWENHPFGMELPTKVFHEKYTSLPLDIQKKVHIFHFPHPFVDLFLHMGIEGFWESKRRVDIIAEIQYNKTTFKGVIGYTFDGKDCYHRCFTERLEEDLAKLRADHLKQQEFPALTVATAPIPGKVVYADLKSQVSYDRSGNVIIKDSRRDVIIKLFNTIG